MNALIIPLCVLVLYNWQCNIIWQNRLKTCWYEVFWILIPKRGNKERLERVFKQVACHSLMNKKHITVCKVLWYKRNKTLHHMLLLKNKSIKECNSNSASYRPTSYYHVVDYFHIFTLFPITAGLKVFFSLQCNVHHFIIHYSFNSMLQRK